MSWTLLPGVRQDHRGRNYQVLINSRGKEDVVYVQHDSNAPAGYTIPVPEPVKRTVLRKPVATGPATKHLMVVEYRKVGQKAIAKLEFDNSDGEHFIHQEVRCLLRSPDCGSSWLPATGNITDYHVAYHLDEEKNDAQT